VTTQHPNQQKISTLQSTSHQGSYTSNPQTSSKANKGYMGYGIQMQPKSSQYAQTQASSQMLVASNPNTSKVRGEKPKLDPSKLPAAGVRSGHNQN
jgi:hypothetical protein